MKVTLLNTDTDLFVNSQLQCEKLIAVCVKGMTYAIKRAYCNVRDEELYFSLNDVHEPVINCFSVNCCRNTNKKLRNRQIILNSKV